MKGMVKIYKYNLCMCAYLTRAQGTMWIKTIDTLFCNKDTAINFFHGNSDIYVFD